MILKKQRFDIIKHDLVPEHTILSKNECKQLFQKYNIQSDQLPKIFDSDPVTISIGAKPGQILKIVRKSPTAKYAVGYRLVVESTK